MTANGLLLLLALLTPQEKGDASDPKEALRELWKPVTLTLKNTSARAAFEQIFEQSGQKLTLPNYANSRQLTVNLQGVTFWQAVDEVCRLDGNLAIASGSRPVEGIVIEPWTGRPAAYAGPLRFSIDDVDRIRELRYPSRLDRTELTILVQWTDKFIPVLDPWPYPGTVELVRAETASGHSLLPPVDVGENFIRSAGGTSGHSSKWLVRLQPADRAEKEITRLDVLWKTMFPAEVEVIAFDTPLESEGVVRQVGPFTVTLESCKRDPRGGSGLETLLLLQADTSKLPPETLRSLQEVPLEQRVLNEVEVDGKKRRDSFKVVEGTRQPTKVTLRTWLSGSPDPQTVKFHIAKRAILLAIPLTFTNIRLPEEKR